jgi:hypothetical protein
MLSTCFTTEVKPPMFLGFFWQYWGLTQRFMLVRLVLYHLSHVPVPLLVFEFEKEHMQICRAIINSTLLSVKQGYL